MILSDKAIRELNYKLPVDAKHQILDCLSADGHSHGCWYCSIKDECEAICNQTFCGSQVPCEYVIHKLFEAVVK